MIALFKTTGPVKNTAMQIIRNIIDQASLFYDHKCHCELNLLVV